jgi:hypothetical protein
LKLHEISTLAKQFSLNVMFWNPEVFATLKIEPDDYRILLKQSLRGRKVKLLGVYLNQFDYKYDSKRADVVV